MKPGLDGLLTSNDELEEGSRHDGEVKRRGRFCIANQALVRLQFPIIGDLATDVLSQDMCVNSGMGQGAGISAHPSAS
jgi:hypothetical protein